jgi:Protein of unknown function DUF262/Protein of unknown function (DUF1524)
MASTEVDALFKPTSASIRQLLSDLVGGFCIPAYQRSYRWKPADQRRLCEDLISGLDRLVRDESAVSFVGAIITVSGVDDRHVTQPSEPRQIIDGQQRLTTILMIAVAAHELLGKLIVNIDGKNATDQDTQNWLIEQVSEVRSNLKSCLSQTKAYGDVRFRPLPKIIRDMADVWSVHEATARYISPIANLLHTYILHNETSPFTLGVPSVHIQPEAIGSSPEDFQVFNRRFQQIRDLVTDVSKGSEGDLAESIDLDSIIGANSYVLTSLFQGVTDRLAPSLRAASANDAVGRCVRLLLFARFMLERMALTHINAKDESYAFDLFDSLNTTGEPLTAFETFVPLVVQAEGEKAYQSSPSYGDISLTSRLLGNAADVQQQTQKMVTSFLLADAGLKVPNNHNSQRRELTQRYKSTENIDQQRAMTRQLANSAQCYFDFWKGGELHHGLGTQGLKVASETRFALGFLNKINHTVVIAPISRYFATWNENPTEANQNSLEKIVLGITSFSALWRTAHGGTDGIDTQYRKIMHTGVKDYCGPLARTKSTKSTSHDLNQLPDVDSVLAGLRSLLGQSATCGFETREDWVSIAAGRPIYDEQVELSRFLLLLASHHAVPDGSTGFTKDGQIADHTDLLNGDRYDTDDRLATIEHVAPQANSEGSWESSVYSKPVTVNMLGNLTLLPLDDNSMISNRSWSEKKSLYRALSADAPDESRIILEEAIKHGLNLSQEKCDYIVERRQHLPVLQSVAAFEGAWDATFIENRTIHLLTRAWSILDKWL